MKLTAAEKLIIELLCDSLMDKKSDYDIKFIKKAVSSNETWAISMKYESLQDGSKFPLHVIEVISIFETYRWILNTSDELRHLMAEVRSQVNGQVQAPEKFDGFDGNNETEHLSAARMLVDELGQYPEQKDKTNNSHMPRRNSYIRVANAFIDLCEKNGTYVPERSVKNLTHILNEASKLKMDQVLLDQRWVQRLTQSCN